MKIIFYTLLLLGHASVALGSESLPLERLSLERLSLPDLEKHRTYLNSKHHHYLDDLHLLTNIHQARLTEYTAGRMDELIESECAKHQESIKPLKKILREIKSKIAKIDKRLAALLLHHDKAIDEMTWEELEHHSHYLMSTRTGHEKNLEALIRPHRSHINRYNAQLRKVSATTEEGRNILLQRKNEYERHQQAIKPLSYTIYTLTKQMEEVARRKWNLSSPMPKQEVWRPVRRVRFAPEIVSDYYYY
jgi:hypothetical protein